MTREGPSKTRALREEVAEALRGAVHASGYPFEGTNDPSGNGPDGLTTSHVELESYQLERLEMGGEAGPEESWKLRVQFRGRGHWRHPDCDVVVFPLPEITLAWTDGEWAVAINCVEGPLIEKAHADDLVNSQLAKAA